MKPSPHCKQHEFFHPVCIDCQYIKREAKKQARREREELLRSLGLKKVRGNLGGTFWE